jgi:hypothetical protein
MKLWSKKYYKGILSRENLAMEPAKVSDIQDLRSFDFNLLILSAIIIVVIIIITVNTNVFIIVAARLTVHLAACIRSIFISIDSMPSSI